MQRAIFSGTLGFLLGIGTSIATASIYDLDDVYRMAEQAKDAAEEARDAIGSPYAYGSLAWQLRKAAECD